MGQLIANSFSRYTLTDEEEINGTLLSIEQIYVLQNQIADISEQILALEFNPQEPQQFMQNEAFLRGQLTFARFRLEASETIRSSLKEI